VLRQPGDYWPIPDGCRCGWLGSIDISLLAPHVTNHQSSTVNVGPFTDSVHLPGGDLDWTVSPKFAVGYRFYSGLEFWASYQGIASGGNFWLYNFDPNGPVPMWSRFHVNVVDFDFARQETSLNSWWIFRWKAGARIASAWFSTEAQGYVVDQHISNRFVGAGPHLALDAWRILPVRGLALFGRLEAAYLIGQSCQRFEESVAMQDGSTADGVTHNSGLATPWVLHTEVGLTYNLADRAPWLSLSLAYQYEQWFNIGTGGSATGLILQGPVFRGEINF
jgi:hypothetical protein